MQIRTIFIPKNSGGTVDIDIGPNPTQIPTNNIVQTKLDTYSILGKTPGNLDPQLPDNARVKSLINSSLANYDDTLTGLATTDSNLLTEINNLKNNPVGGKIAYKLPCSENIQPGKYINIWVDNGVSKIRLANASNGRLVNGYVDEAFNIGEEGTFFKDGKNINGNVCPRGPLYLSPTSPGDATTERPLDRSGNWYQEIGHCVGDGIHIFELGFSIQLL